MPRTTLMLDDDLLRRLKAEAAKRGKTLGSVVNEMLRQSLATRPRRGEYTLELVGWEAELQPGVDILDRDNLFDLMNGR